MPLTERLNELIQACFTGLWIESQEHEDAQREIAELCREQQWRLATWNLETGLAIPGQGESPSATGQDRRITTAILLRQPVKEPLHLLLHITCVSCHRQDSWRKAAQDRIY